MMQNHQVKPDLVVSEPIARLIGLMSVHGMYCPECWSYLGRGPTAEAGKCKCSACSKEFSFLRHNGYEGVMFSTFFPSPFDPEEGVSQR